MKTAFELLISFRTPSGFKICGQYFLGTDRNFAEHLFAGLRGCNDTVDKTVLHLDLMEMSEGVPSKIKSLSCNMNEFCDNCRYITRELFRTQAVSPADMDSFQTAV